MIPVTGLSIPFSLVVLLMCCTVGLLLYLQISKKKPDWFDSSEIQVFVTPVTLLKRVSLLFREIDIRELEMGEILGVGGYGEVRKALWKGTEVAVKTMASERITKQMKRNYVEEVT